MRLEEKQEKIGRIRKRIESVVDEEGGDYDIMFNLFAGILLSMVKEMVEKGSVDETPADMVFLGVFLKKAIEMTEAITEEEERLNEI